MIILKVINNRLAHITHMDSCIWNFSAGLPTFCNIFITFILGKSCSLSKINCRSVVRPWLHNPKVLGSNPIDAQKFFSIIPNWKVAWFNWWVLRKWSDWPWETSTRAQTSKSSQLNKTSSEPTYLYITLILCLPLVMSQGMIFFLYLYWFQIYKKN